MWFIAPEVAYVLGHPRRLPGRQLDADDRLLLRRVARRTWRYFEVFVGPDDQWLPPDNFQEQPRGEVAHRTSPTNIGMMFLSSLAACDLGYIGLDDLRSRLHEQPRYARTPRPVSWPSAQLVRHSDARAAHPTLRVHRRQRQSRGEPPGAQGRVSRARGRASAAAAAVARALRCGRGFWTMRWAV